MDEESRQKELEQQRKEREHQEDLENLKRMRPMDDTFARAMLRDNIPLAQMILCTVMEKPDLVITELKTQADMNRVTGARSVCLDAYGADSEGKKYDIEIQRDPEEADPQRVRYHMSVMGVENLDAGQKFRELPDAYVVFITEEDYFKDGAAVHTFKYMEESTGKSLGDGSYILYVNGEYRGDDDIGRLMHDFNCPDAGDMNFPLMAEKTRYLKENPKGVSEMCAIMDDIRNKGRAEGLEQGLEQGRLEMLAGLVSKGILTLQQAAEERSLTVDDFKKQCKLYNLSL